MDTRSEEDMQSLIGQNFTPQEFEELLEEEGFAEGKKNGWEETPQMFLSKDEERSGVIDGVKKIHAEFSISKKDGEWAVRHIRVNYPDGTKKPYV